MFPADLVMPVFSPVGTSSTDLSDISVVDKIHDDYSGLPLAQYYFRCFCIGAVWCSDNSTLSPQQRSRTIWMDNNDRQTLL